jgi:hypothetical protein
MMIVDEQGDPGRRRIAHFRCRVFRRDIRASPQTRLNVSLYRTCARSAGWPERTRPVGPSRSFVSQHNSQ